MIRPGDEVGEVRRATLPLRWPTDFDAPIRLIRRFGRPPIDAEMQSVELEIREVPGLTSIELNGAFCELTSDGRIPLPGPLRSKNELILSVGVDPGNEGGPPRTWGSIALVILRKGDHPG